MRVSVDQSCHYDQREQDVVLLRELVVENFRHWVERNFEIPVRFVGDKMHDRFLVGVRMLIEARFDLDEVRRLVSWNKRQLNDKPGFEETLLRGRTAPVFSSS